MQLFVVQIKDKCYVFNNHEAALKCRNELKGDSHRLWGQIAWDDWQDGQPIRKVNPVGPGHPC